VKKLASNNVGRVGNRRQVGVKFGAWWTDIKGRQDISGQTLKLIFYLQKCRWSYLTSVFSLVTLTRW